MEAWSSVLWFIDITNAAGILAKAAPPTGSLLVGDNMSTVTQYLECRFRSEVSSMAPSSLRQPLIAGGICSTSGCQNS
jgi:hypothetical protein